MKWCRRTSLRHRRLLLALLVVTLLGFGMAARGALEEWVQNVEGAGRFEAVFFRPVPMPSGQVLARRPPKESRAVLNEFVSKSPSDAELFLMRARVEEQQLDFTAAEGDWQKRAQLLPGPASGQLELADFYHRRLRPLEEVKALATAAQAASSPSERLLPASQQRSWRAFERIFSMIQAQALPVTMSGAQYRAWIERYPKEPSVYAQFFAFSLGHKQFADAERLIATYQKAFPDDNVFPVRANASLEYRRGSTDRALALYDHAFQPLWPAELVQNYFTLLRDSHRLRDFLDRARAAVTASPQDLNAAARVFYYYQQQGNLADAQRALLEYRLRMESRQATWTSEQLWTLGQLFEGVHNYDEAARCYYALYSLPGADAASTEKALGGIINLLLSAPEQPMRFGSEDFSFLRDVGTLDPYPGFLNGILSLLLNSQWPAQQYSQQEGASVAYFHRARAAELLPLFDSRYPQSPQRSDLRAKLLEVYANYGASDAVIRDGREFLSAFPKSSERVRVALLLADALARKDQVQEELAVYDTLLEELVARADRVPLGAGPGAADRGEIQEENVTPPPGTEQEEEESAAPRAAVAPPQVRARRAPGGGARSPEYARVLERYISRLVALKRPFQVLSLFRREMDRNPNDPGLYERLATFLDQNRLGEGVDLVYRRALQQFPERTWYHKLARWYLRRRQTGEFEKLSREIIRVFSGTELEKYFREVVGQASLDSRLYQQLNLYAHTRFPHNLAFVHNLLQVYMRPETRDQAAWESLLRQHWYYHDGLRARFFAYLAEENRLDRELQAIRSSNPASAGGRWQELASANPAATQFVAEAELWRCHFETAAPLLRAIAAEFPADDALGRRASAVYRSLAAFDPQDTDIAAGIEENLSRYEPGDRDTLTRLGEIYADREMFNRSRPYWNRVAQVEPGNPKGYLEAATVFWDYYLFDDTLRLINEGRKKFANPALYAYEAGAVYENKRDFPRAVEEYVKGALAGEGQSPARARLLELARRPQLRSLVEQATAKQVSGLNPEAAAVSLRVAVLQALDRRNDLEKFLSTLVENATSLELLERIDPVAEQQGFDPVRARLLERRAALTTDPLERLRLRLAIERFQEAKGDMEAARRVMEAVYTDNPTILGVVRATVDFYWRNKLRDPAIDTLLRAVKASYPALKKQFTFEAARKATEARQYARARELLAPLLQDDPYHAEYLAAMADTYAREGDDRALRDFHLAKIQALREAPLTPDERTSRIAALRRGLIPALTRLEDFAGAVDQYVEILNRYPEDEGLAQEAAAYADRHNRRKQLLDYYAKAASDSPRDSRWPMILARLQTHFEDYPAAIASYFRARQVRPDRSDLLIARAALEERLMRFDDAVQSYTQVYDLTYRNTQWMEKVAEVRARQGQTEAVVQALRKALIEGRPERPGMFFEAARRLDSWNLLPQAREFAERGVSLAGRELLADRNNLDGTRVYARVMTKLREHQAAYARLLTAARAASLDRGPSNLPAALQEIGQTVRSYFTPEELNSFVSFLEKQKEGMPLEDFERNLVPLTHSAGLAELEARWRYELMMGRPGAPETQAHESRLIELQRRRMKFDELGAQLEAYWNVCPHDPGKDYILEQAAASYRSAGNTAAELRVLSTMFRRRGLAAEMLERYFGLLLANDPQRLVSIAVTGGAFNVRDAAANFAVASGNGGLALQAIAARGRDLPPVWTRAYTGLMGLYYSDAAPEVKAAYQAALGTGTIGDRLGNPVDRDQQLAGDIWFYYGSRYGEYLAVTRQGNPEDYLPATLEATPGRADAYFTLAEYYREAGEYDRALADYAHTLGLDSRRGEAHDRMAVILWQQGKQEEATAHWKQALKAFARQEEGRRLPATFWEYARVTLENIGERKLLPEAREEAGRLLRNYIRRNGSYRADPLLRGAMAASADPGSGVAWILELAHAAPNQVEFLGGMAGAKWVPAAQKEIILRRVIEVAEEQMARSYGAARSAAQDTLRRWQVRWLGYLVDTRQTERAQAALSAFPDEARRLLARELIPLKIRIAAQGNRLDATLEGFRSDPEKAPPLEDLRNAAAVLRKVGDNVSARRVLEFVYSREIEQHNLTPANFLGLAEVRLQSGDLSQAMVLLRRMALVSGEPFVNLNAAAELLVKTGHPAEAPEFLAARVKAAPWDGEARLRLAQAQIAANREHELSLKLLASVAALRETPYETRAAAAVSLASLKAGELTSGSSELDLLASGGPKDAAAAERPWFYQARLEAAERVSDLTARIRLLLDALAINPEADSPRVSLFQNALSTGQYQLALSAMEPLLEPGGSSYRYQDRSPGAEGLTENAEGVSYEVNSSSPQFLPRTGLGAAQRASLAGNLAEVFEKLGRLSEAEAYWETAFQLEPSDASRTELQRRLQSVRCELKRLEQDTLRQPVVTEHLEQKNLVRPRLAAPTARTTGSGPGGGKGR